MREIKFRGIRVDNNEWVYGFYIEGASNGSNRILNHAIAERGFYPVEVKPETVCQYIVLKDKNGVDVYENDVVKWDINGTSVIAPVYYEESCASFWMGKRNGTGSLVLNDWFRGEYEVIGNIHEQEA